MSRLGTSDLFTVDNDPDVIAAREKCQAARRAAETASHGYKRKKQFQLQQALHDLMRVELATKKKLEEAGHVQPKARQEEPPKAPRQDDFTPRECGDDTNYRPGRRTD